MYSEGFCYKGETILKCGRQNGRQKQGCLSKNSIFDRIKLSNMQKNEAFIRSFRINTSFWCGRKERSDGIARNERPRMKTYDDIKKPWKFKAFLLLNANMDANFFWGER